MVNPKVKWNRIISIVAIGLASVTCFATDTTFRDLSQANQAFFSEQWENHLARVRLLDRVFTAHSEPISSPAPEPSEVGKSLLTEPIWRNILIQSKLNSRSHSKSVNWFESSVQKETKIHTLSLVAGQLNPKKLNQLLELDLDQELLSYRARFSPSQYTAALQEFKKESLARKKVGYAKFELQETIKRRDILEKIKSSNPKWLWSRTALENKALARVSPSPDQMFFLQISSGSSVDRFNNFLSTRDNDPIAGLQTWDSFLAGQSEAESTRKAILKEKYKAYLEEKTLLTHRMHQEFLARLNEEERRAGLMITKFATVPSAWQNK